jgi:hypothetical protein
VCGGGYTTTKLQNYKTTKLQNYKTTKLQNYTTTQLHNYTTTYTTTQLPTQLQYKTNCNARQTANYKLQTTQNLNFKNYKLQISNTKLKINFLKN